jgi:hypothetical protein
MCAFNGPRCIGAGGVRQELRNGTDLLDFPRLFPIIAGILIVVPSVIKGAGGYGEARMSAGADRPNEFRGIRPAGEPDQPVGREPRLMNSKRSGAVTFDVRAGRVGRASRNKWRRRNDALSRNRKTS